MPEATKSELDGFGRRVTAIEILSSSQTSRISRNEQDIQKIFETLSRLPYWIIGSVLVPTILIIYQIVSTHPK